MTDQPTTSDLLKKSVTALDVGSVSNGVVNLIIPLWPSQYVNTQALPPTPPAYWTPNRDDVLRSTVHHEAMWAAAVSIAITKVASKAWEVKSDVPRRARTFREIILYADGRTQGYTQFIFKHLRDFLTTDNGSFIEIVRSSKSWSSSIIGLRHLDSRRCQRTGDPDIPVLYRDRRGQYHELRDYQVMYFSDMPDPSETYYGVGQCSASRAYPSIYKLAGLERYVGEKITGLRPLAVYIVNGMVQRQIEGAIESAKEGQMAQGVAAYMGAVIVGIPADKPPQVATIPLAELPDRFERKEEFDIALLTYADNLGLDPQELQPLSGQPLGTGAQSQVLHDKASAKGLVGWQQEWTHKLNEQVLPDLTEFVFIERDYRDMSAKAGVTKARVDAYKVMSDAGFILPEQGTRLLVDDDELPKEFLEQIQATGSEEETISDTEKPDAQAQEPTPDQAAQQQALQAVQQQAQQPPAQGQPEQPMPPAVPTIPSSPTAKEAHFKQASHTGAMLALVPPMGVAKRLAEFTQDWPAGSEPTLPEEMHITLTYLGDTSELPYTQEHVQNVLSHWLSHCAPAPITGQVNGIGRFIAEDKQGRIPIYANFDAPALPALRQSLVDALQMASIQVNMEHGFQPHLTLAYVPKDAPMPTGNWDHIDDVTMPLIVLAWGDSRTTLMLAASATQKAKDDIPLGDPDLLFAEHDQPDHAQPTPQSQDPQSLVEEQLDAARRLYARLRKRKEMSSAVGKAVFAIAEKHIPGVHNQRLHGNRLGGTTDILSAGRSEASGTATDAPTASTSPAAAASGRKHSWEIERNWDVVKEGNSWRTRDSMRGRVLEEVWKPSPRNGNKWLFRRRTMGPPSWLDDIARRNWQEKTLVERTFDTPEQLEAYLSTIQ